MNTLYYESISILDYHLGILEFDPLFVEFFGVFWPGLGSNLFFLLKILQHINSIPSEAYSFKL